MSVYSGFATRQQQHQYNNLTQNLVVALNRRIIKFYQSQPCDEDKFAVLIKKIYKNMFLLERGKFMAPKFSTCITDLIQILGIHINLDSLSDTSSMDSQIYAVKSRANNINHEVLKTRAILQTKRTHLQSYNNLNPLRIPILSVNKKLHTLQQENQYDLPQRGYSLNTSTVKHCKSNKRNKAKYRGNQCKEIEEFKGPLSMPRIQDFLPRILQNQQSDYIYRTTPKELKGLRKHKFSRNSFQLLQN